MLSFCLVLITMVFVGPVSLFGSPGSVEAGRTPKDEQQSIEAATQRIKAQFGLELVYQDFERIALPDTVYEKVESVDYAGLWAYVKLFEEEVRKYPGCFFEGRAIQKVFFIKKLFYKGEAAEGFYHHPTKMIFLDFLRSRGNPITQRHNIHHELFHAIEIDSRRLKDALWEQFNAGDFVYGNQSRGATEKNPINYFAPDRPGFVSDYAMVSLEEDKAEVFACLMMPSQNNIIHRWMAKDKILHKKVAYIKYFIYQYCSEMDRNYWRKMGG